jgi:NADH:ubiquinone oxidoreductase subunit B-like Fe-S oxidoreductase
MTTDCINKKHKRLKRIFPEKIDALNKTFTLGSCGQKGGVFQVSFTIPIKHGF